MMYQQIALMMRDAFKAPRFRYEPYLWNLNASNASWGAYGPENLSARGMQVHQATPLFLEGEHPVHDSFLWSLYGGSASLPGDPELPDAWLAKIIRGSGRLEAYLKAFPDLKIVLCLRNPLDTLNSSLGMFSFTGEEFHASDAPRLLAEVAEHLPHLSASMPEKASHLAVSALWWRSFTEWSLRVAARYPQRCFIFRHELLADRQDALVEELASFLGFSSPDVFKLGISKPAGRVTSATYLLGSDIGELYPHLRYYLDDCLSGDMTEQELATFEERLLARYAERKFSPQLAGDRLGRRSTIGLRNDILGGHDVALKHVAPQPDDQVRIPLRERIEAYASDNGLSVGAYKRLARPAIAKAGGRTFGCCITSHNNRQTIRDAIYSALDQTRPFDRIVVVDDASNDGTPAILRDLEGRYTSLEIIYQAQTVGMSAARHIGIEALGTDFITELDGDDCFWPTKNREEGEVVLDDPTAIAFSDYLSDRGPSETEQIDTRDYAGDPVDVFSRMLALHDGMPRDLTFASSLYAATGGYDPRLGLYEDWDLKLRLARVSGPWRRSSSAFGTVYNLRQDPSKTRDPAIRRRAIVQVFLKAALAHPETRRLADVFAVATRGVHDQMTNALYSFLMAHDDGAASLQDLRPLAGREWAAKSHDDFALSAIAIDRDRRGVISSVHWSPLQGFGANQAPYSEIPRPEFYWQIESSARAGVEVFEPVPGLLVELYSPVRDNEVRVEVVDGPFTLFSQTFTLQKSLRRDGVLQPLTLNIDMPLERGRYELRLTTAYFTEKTGSAASAPRRKLHVILGSIVNAGGRR
jgi:hypothetical protein